MAIEGGNAAVDVLGWRADARSATTTLQFAHLAASTPASRRDAAASTTRVTRPLATVGSPSRRRTTNSSRRPATPLQHRVGL
jgi:hypothetical protein